MNITSKEKYNIVDYELDFGQINKNTKLGTTLEFKGSNIKNFEAIPACGCTTTTPKIVNNELIELYIAYKNTNILGLFKKTITILYTENGIKQKIYLKIKGEII